MPQLTVLLSSYAQLHQILRGGTEGVGAEVLKEYLESRIESLKSISSPFGKPSDASRKKVQSGSVQLPDGVRVKVEEPDKEFVLAISNKYQIDEVHALVLFRSFLYSNGLPMSADKPAAALVEELVTIIAPYYHSERLWALLVLGPLLRAFDDPTDPLCEVAAEFLPKVHPDPSKFALDLVKEYTLKTKTDLPLNLRSAPKDALEWTKQNLKEQLALLQLLFWTLWSYTTCSASVVLGVMEAAYHTSLGTAQRNTSLMLDDESSQLQQDCAAFWILITLEVLELETIGSLSFEFTPEGEPEDKGLYISSPNALLEIHDIINSDTNSQFAATYLAWAHVLSSIDKKAKTMDLTTVMPEYRKVFDMITPTSSYTKNPEPVYLEMTKACVSPQAGLFTLLRDLLTKSPVFVVSVAWKTGSSVIDPNAVAYRSTLKGASALLIHQETD